MFAQADNIVFVDDNIYNIDTAVELGFKSVLFGTDPEDSGHDAVKEFNELLKYLD